MIYKLIEKKLLENAFRNRTMSGNIVLKSCIADVKSMFAIFTICVENFSQSKFTDFAAFCY